MSKPLRVLVWLTLVAAAFAVAANYWLQREYTKPGPTTRIIRVEVPSGASVRAVLAKLGKSGVLEAPRAVELHLRLHGRHPRVKAGSYDIPEHASAAEIVRLLEQGLVVLEHLTVVEGSTFAELRRSLERHPAIRATLRGRSDAEVMVAVGHPGETPEGWFFPDTYRFAANTPDVDILKLAHESMHKVVEETWRLRRADLPVHTPNEALTLASIVEKETGLATERALIAGVFTRRLRIGMPLQSDPTVIYGLGARYDGDIRKRDLSVDTPYNTYTRTGLPPTPIALPGRDSVLAATKPEETGALYFVAVGDGSGAHYFSKTLDEHNKAVRRYLERLRSQSEAARHAARTRGT